MPDSLRKRCEAMLREAGCSEKVIAHCGVVRDVACEYAQRNPTIDFSLVEEGALLHDIGRGSTHTIGHAQAGADLLRAKGFPEQLARIVECHTGAGLTADECAELGLEPRNCMPATIEEKIVCHADNLVAKTKRITIEESVASSSFLPMKFQERMYRLSAEVELYCNK
ncbi:MAG: HDIG domain-containing metalloprotein [Methanomicrobiales archaeon]